MSELIYLLVNIPYLTTGRRLYALKRAHEEATKAGLAPLVALLEEAIAHDTRTAEIERSWSRSKSVSTARGESAALDSRIDGLLGAVYATLNSNVSLLDADDPAASDSKKILAELYPEGVVPIITLPFEEQLVVNDSIIASLKGKFAEAAQRAGVDRYVERLEAVNELFRAELKKYAVKEVDYRVLEAAQDKGNLFVRRVAAVIMGTFHQDTEEAAAMRRTLLSPILEQGERVRQSRKGRKSASDVDPETGEEVSPPANGGSASKS